MSLTNIAGYLAHQGERVLSRVVPTTALVVLMGVGGAAAHIPASSSVPLAPTAAVTAAVVGQSQVVVPTAAAPAPAPSPVAAPTSIAATEPATAPAAVPGVHPGTDEQAKEEIADLVPEQYRQLVVSAARKYSIHPRLLAAVGTVETGTTWNPGLVGAAGEIGLTQVMPATYDWMITKGKVSYCGSLYEPVCSLEVGAAYVRYMLDLNGWNVVDAMREYNGGGDWAHIPATVRYADKMMAYVDGTYQAGK